MTSEGQHAGHQPGVTSGSGADQFGPDGFPPDAFPPDSDGHLTADRAPSYPHAQESFPSAYAPPPHATPNGGSPFVVPAVPPAGHNPAPPGPAVPGSPAAQQPGPQQPGFPPADFPPPGFPPPGTQHGSQPPGTLSSASSSPGYPPPAESSGYSPAAGSPGYPPAAESPGYPPAAESPGYPPAQSPGYPPAAESSGYPPAAQSPGYPPAGFPPPGSQPSGSPASGQQASGPQAAGSRTPGPAFGAGAATFSSGSSGSARVPEPGSLPQRPPAAAQGHADAFATPEVLESAWAPPPPAQPTGAAEENPFTRPAEPHPYRGGSDQLPQRSPGIAGGPLDGPVGEFNGFTPARQPAEPAPGGGTDMPPRAGGSPFDRQPPADRPPFGAPADQPPFGAASGPADRSSFGPAPREPLGGAGETFGSASSDADQQPGDRPPGVSAFGDQRVRVPGATLTGLPDAPPVVPDSGAFPTRGGSESGGFPTRGGSGNGSFPIRGAGARSGGAFPNRGDAAGSAFPGRDEAASANFPNRDEAGSGTFPNRGDAASGTFPGRDEAGSGAFPSRGEAAGGFSPRGAADNAAFGSGSGAFSARAAADNGTLPTRGGAFPASGEAARDNVDSEGFPVGDHPDSNPFRDGSFRRAEADGDFPAPGTTRGASDGDHGSGAGRPISGQPDGLPARRGFGDRPDEGGEQSSPFARPEAARFDSEQPSDGSGSGGYAQRIPGASFAAAGSPDAGRAEGGAAGYAQRVPGASFGSGGSPMVAEPRSAAAVPQPRDPAERPDSGESPGAAERPGPAKGTARPVSASASVPVASRVTPADAEEVPPPPVASPQSRVYGRPAPADAPAPQSPYQDQEQPVGGAFGAAPPSGARGAVPTSGAHGQPPENPYARPVDGTYGKPPVDGTYGSPASADGTYGSPASAAGTYGRPSDAPFGARPSSGASPFGNDQDDRAGRQDDPFPPRPSSGGHGTAPEHGSPVFGTAPEPAGTAPERGGSAAEPGAPDAAPTSGAFGAAPTSGGGQPSGRPSGRATASARVTPPPPGQPFAPASPAPGQAPDGRNAAQFTEFTTDIAGRGRSGQPDQPGPVPGNPAARTVPPNQYSENTTDVSGRGQGPEQPYVPAPALPSMHAAPPLENGFPPAQAPDSTQPFGERPRMGGVFPGPASRATVTPPGPDQTAAWPSRAEPEADQGRFDSFKPDAPEVVPTEVAKPDTPHVRMLPVILGVILGAGLIVGLTLGVTWLIARGSHDGGTNFSVSAGDCVKRSGNEAVTANCSDAGSFEVTAIVDTKEQCPDPNQPYVVNPTDNGRSQVLCLKPRS